MKIAIIGTGYVGLTTGTTFAEKGHEVKCIDSDASKIKKLKQGAVSIYEPGLDSLVRKNIKRKRLVFGTRVQDACDFAKVIFLCLPTPTLPNGNADLSYIEGVSRKIAEYIKDYHLLVDKSTVPVMTGERIRQIVTRYNKHKVDFDVASNPEFLREGNAVEDALNPDRIVVGVENKRAELIFRDIYKNFKSKLVITDVKSAEIIKHAANSFLAMKISFINGIARLCDAVGADVKVVARGIGLDRRISPSFLEAGIGYGGSCFSKDVNAFYGICNELGFDFKMLREIETMNKEIREFFIKKIQQELWIVKGKKIAILGLSFKKNTDDIRNSVPIFIARELASMGALLHCYDPRAMPNARKALREVRNISFGKSAYDVCKGADALAILTDWDMFKELKFNRIKKEMNTAIIFDGRNILDPMEIKSMGFVYRGVGRAYYEKE